MTKKSQFRTIVLTVFLGSMVPSKYSIFRLLGLELSNKMIPGWACPALFMLSNSTRIVAVSPGMTGNVGYRNTVQEQLLLVLSMV